MPRNHPAREIIQMFYRMMLMIPKTPLPVCIVKFSTVSPLLSGLSVREMWAVGLLAVCWFGKEECSFATAVGLNKCSSRHHLYITACLGLKPGGHSGCNKLNNALHRPRHFWITTKYRFSTTKSGRAHKDWKVGGQLPALPNRLRRLW